MAYIIDGGFPDSTYDEEPDVGSYSPSTRSVAEVLRHVKRQFGDESGVQIEDADIISWINDAQTTINNANRILKTKSTVGSIPGVADYRFPEEHIRQVESIHYDGSRVPNMTFEEAQAHVIGRENEGNGVPSLWYEWAGQFTFWPAPSDSRTITFYATLSPRALSGDVNEKLGLPDKYFKQICDYVLAQAYELDEDWAAVQAKNQQFTEGVNALGEEERQAQNMTYPTVTVIDI